jgi:hypothetical protein
MLLISADYFFHEIAIIHFAWLAAQARKEYTGVASRFVDQCQRPPLLSPSSGE